MNPSAQPHPWPSTDPQPEGAKVTRMDSWTWDVRSAGAGWSVWVFRGLHMLVLYLSTAGW